jgi:hypothetical protein
MRIVEDAVHVDATPLEVWGWIAHLVDHYTEWHPDHVSAEWIAGPPNRVGSVMRAVESLGTHQEDLLFELAEFEPPRRFSYRIGRSVGLILPRGSFEIEPDDSNGCWFRAQIGYRFGPVTEWVFRRRIADLRNHMAEEGANLKRLVEAA